MARLDPTAPEVTFEYNGAAVSYNLAADENGVLQWFPTFIDEVPAENRSTPSAFSYNDAPRTVSQVLDFADWSLGAGFVDAPPGTASFRGYSYSRGVDASEGRLVLSPQLQSLSNSVSSFTGMYLSPTFGVYAWRSSLIYRLQGGDWVQVYSGTGAITDIKEYGNTTAVYLFAAKGTAADVVYSTDGFTTAPTTVTSFKTFKFTIRGNTSVEPVMVAITANGLLRTSTNPIANANWSNVDRIGPAGETVTAMVTANDIIWVFKEEGYYTFDGTNVGTQVPVDQLARSNNGKCTIIWLDGFIYTNYGNRILKINPYDNSTEVLLAPAHPEIKGAFTAATADTRWLYYFIQDPVSLDTYCLKISPTDGTAHTYLYFAAEAAISAAMVVPATSDGPSSTNNLLMFDNTTVGRYVTLARDGRRPWEDANCRFDPAGGFIVGPNVDAGVPTYEKWVNGAKELTESTTAARSVALSYDLEAQDSFTTILTAVSPGITEEQVSTEITFTRLRYKATLATGDNEHTPRVVAIMFNTTPNPPRYRAWRLVLDVADQQRRHGGGEPRGEAYKRLLAHLNGAVGKRTTYTDYFGDSFIAKVMTVAVQGVSWTGTQGSRNQARSLVEVLIAEISENDTIGLPFVWGASIYGGGGEWS